MRIKAVLYLLAISIGLFAIQNVHATTSVTSNEKQNVKACNILADVESALTLLRINPDEALNRVNLALSSIEKLDKLYDHYTTVEKITGDDSSIAYVYEHYYPEVSGPNNHCSNYVIGFIKEKYSKVDISKDRIFFDYSLAKAELITAKHAIINGDALEAKNSLKRSIQAVYVNPDFNVKS